jgi:hypothetical protein
MGRRPIKVAAVAPANKIARVAWNEEIGQELHTVPFIQDVQVDNGWNTALYQDYIAPNLHITFLDAVGRRLRHNQRLDFLLSVSC